MTLQQLTQASPGFTIIDIRTPYEFSQQHVTGSVNIPYDLLMTYPDRYLQKNQHYYLICAHGGLSQRAAAILQSYGYHVSNIEHGFDMRMVRYY